MSRTTTRKRVTDPLNNKIKSMIISYESSGSEHSADDDSSPSLSNLVHNFLFKNDPSNEENDSDHELDSPMPEQFPEAEISNFSVYTKFDPFRNLLLANVYKAMEMLDSTDSNKISIRRSIMGYLRDNGYDAAICKTKWEGSGALTAGSYEFIDVARSYPATSSSRYFVDTDFASEFDIARPTCHYERALGKLPGVFVGTGEELKRIVKGMSDLARGSLKSRGLSLPPWRKNRFMQNKWFGAYRRTVNFVPVVNNYATSFPSVGKNGNGCYSVKSRCVGFDAVNNGGLVVPATTRTR